MDRLTERCKHREVEIVGIDNNEPPVPIGATVYVAAPYILDDGTELLDVYKMEVVSCAKTADGEFYYCSNEYFSGNYITRREMFLTREDAKRAIELMREGTHRVNQRAQDEGWRVYIT